MTQATTIPSTHSTCPAWCDSAPHIDGAPHFGGMLDLDLTPGGGAEDWLTASLWQEPGQDSPVIGLMHGDQALPDLTLTQAQALGTALLEMVSRAKALPTHPRAAA